MPTATSDWFNRVYSDPLYLELYEEDDDARAAPEAEGAMRICNAPPAGAWLEACCGFGRHAEHFARAGYRVVGVDRSRLMLRRALARAQGGGLPLHYMRADIRCLPILDRFDCATLMFDSFGYFRHTHEHLDALLSLGLVLKPHGRLLIHLTNREQQLGAWRGTEAETRGAYRISKVRTLDLPRGRLSWTLDIVGAGRTRSWTIDLRLFTASELSDLLEQAGFDQIRFFGDWDRSPYALDSPYMIVVARKATFADMPPLAD